MNNEKILEQQVEALEKLLQLKQAIIDELESKIQKLELDRLNSIPAQPPFIPWIAPSLPAPIFENTDPCIDGFLHEYLIPWLGINPQPCKKCGKTSLAAPTWTTTSSNSVLLVDSGDNTSSTLTHVANR